MSVDIALVAGEVSGDMLASQLLSGLQLAVPQAYTHGIGGPAMQQYGFISHYPMEALSVMGLAEVLRHYWAIKKIHTALTKQLLIKRPNVFIGVDAPDFNLSLEMHLKESGIPTIHCVGPSIWAWRSGRIKKIKRAVSHMLVLFPFEVPLYQAADIPVTYIGHPLAASIPFESDRTVACQSLGLSTDAPVVTLMPGSRLSEIKRLAVDFIQAAQLLLARDSTIQFVLPVVGRSQYDALNKEIESAQLQGVPIHIVENKAHVAIAAAHTVLVASGTATLEVALFKKPMVIAYKLHPLTWHILKYIVHLPHVGLPNILAKERLVPEFLQDQVTPKALADALWTQLHDHRLQSRLADRFLDMHHDLLRDSAKESTQVVQAIMQKHGC